MYTLEKRSEIFIRKLREFDRLIKYASKRCSINGFLDPKDLYQEGLAILDSMLQDDYRYKVDPNSVDFTKLFKTELWHGLAHHFQYYKAQKRHFKNTVKDPRQLETFKDDADLEFFSGLLDKDALSPEQTYDLQQECDLASDFLDSLVSQLDDEARIVLHEILYPRSWDDIPDDCKANQYGDTYWREPKKKIPQAVLARVLDIPVIRLKRAVRRIQRTAAVLGEVYGYDSLPAVLSKRKQKRGRKR